jgi:hypothetical protein
MQGAIAERRGGRRENQKIFHRKGAKGAKGAKKNHNKCKKTKKDFVGRISAA